MALDDMRILIAVEKPRTDVVVVRVAGELDRNTCARLQRAIEGQLCLPTLIGEGRLRHFLIDLSSVSRVDAQALRALERSDHLVRHAGARLQLIGLADRRDVLPGEVVDLLGVFDSAARLEDTLATLAARRDERTASPQLPPTLSVVS